MALEESPNSTQRKEYEIYAKCLNRKNINSKDINGLLVSFRGKYYQLFPCIGEIPIEFRKEFNQRLLIKGKEDGKGKKTVLRILQ